jgi:hypothetical protein
MRSNRRLGPLVAAGILLATLGAPRPVGTAAVVGGTADQQAMVRWATARFESAGLQLPPLEVRFHVDRGACRGRLGYYLDGVVDVCRHFANLWAARELVHEMAHGWLAANLDEAARDRFLALRGLSTWNDQTVDWDARGFEQAAEIMAWAIGDQEDGIYRPSFPENDRDRLAVAYRMLTGRSLPALTPGDRWRGAA